VPGVSKTREASGLRAVHLRFSSARLRSGFDKSRKTILAAPRASRDQARLDSREAFIALNKVEGVGPVRAFTNPQSPDPK
jgi:hypothetical protein